MEREHARERERDVARTKNHYQAFPDSGYENNWKTALHGDERRREESKNHTGGEDLDWEAWMGRGGESDREVDHQG